MDAGNKIDAMPCPPPCVVSPAEKVCYPKFTLNEEAAAEFMKECPCDKDCEVEFKVRARICGFSSGDYGSSLTFEVTKINDIEKMEDGEEPDEKSVAGMMIRKRKSEEY